MSGLRAFQRRSFLQGIASGVAGAVVAGSVDHGVARAATEDDYNMEATREGVRSVPFYGRNQAGIATAPQTAASFLAFDVTAANRGELTALFRTLTARAAFLTTGGTPPPTPTTSTPSNDRLLGPTVLPDDLTVTVGLGASLFDGRYGLGPSKPAQLETMRAFAHDNLDPAISDGDLLVQLCAGRRDTVGHAMLDVLASTGGGMRLR
jgi:deferrochelatase/peroxidase EfeB